MSAICLWCPRVFLPRVTGGRKQRFCSPRCRKEFFECARAWAVAEVEAGRLTPAQLAKGPKANVHVAPTTEAKPAGPECPVRQRQ